MFPAPKPTSNLVRPDFDKFLDYSRVFFEHHQYTNDGALVKQLEQRLAAFHQTEFCVAFCSGFWALALAISALARPGRSEIVMPSFTYRRMADIAAWTRLKPHFCDVEESTLANSAATVRPCINDNTALILGVHPIVNFCDIDGLVDLAKERDIPLLFDSVESVYESYAGRKIGCFGAGEIFSLGASKLVNGFEGGYLTTNDAQLAEHLALIRGFGFNGPDNVAVPGGLNAKLNEIHAAMALAGLDDLEDQVVRNRERYLTYQRLLAPLKGIRLLEFDESHRPGYKNIVIEVLDDWPLSRDDTVSLLNAEMILARAYYTPPLHRKRMAYPHVPVALPVTDRLAERYILPPCGHLVSNEDIARIVVFLGFISANAAAIKVRLQQREALK
ncbi:MAG: aminotransferase class I/II-fold pyridoxal phosphate-dependent enzyme [Nitrosomonadales bacterium]|nr:aminotransferase class I/II-fold pyridoxal phosphate-dependent enzyme [Nitrosomonadales bacterium]